jgi:hypothetical protein
MNSTYVLEHFTLTLSRIGVKAFIEKVSLKCNPNCFIISEHMLIYILLPIERRT